MEKKMLEVGDVVFRSTKSGQIKELKITSIGKKYFYCDSDKSTPYSLVDMRFRGQSFSGADHKLYNSELEITEEKESKIMFRQIEKHFEWNREGELTHFQLTRILQIINEK